MKLFNSAIYFCVVLILSGCNKFLEEEPKKQTTIKSIDQLEALLDNATAFSYEGNNPTAVYSTDDTEITTEAYAKNVGRFSVENLYRYVFNINEIEGLAADPLWNGEYKKIFTANLILYYVDKVSGSILEKEKVKADAHFLRAYSYWELANFYCVPYSGKNGDALGLPLKKTIDFEESLKRSSLKETYDFIESDLIEAEKTAVEDVDPNKRWRVNKKAIQAFKSRYYLFLGDYDKSLDNSNKALTSQGATLMNYNDIVAGTPTVYSNPSVTLAYSEFNNWAASKFLYYKELYYTRYSYTSSQWWLPSSALLSLYDKSNDNRYKWLMIENGGRRFSIINPSLVRYSFFSDGRYIPIGPTVAEILLNKAEVLARKGEFNTAMQFVNQLREKRMITSAPLTATSKDDAIKKVLEERRREMPFWMRWMDIRRFSINDYPADDVTVKRTFFKVGVGVVDLNSTQEYTLPVGSKWYANPINGVEIDASKGVIVQNSYE